MIDGFIQQQQVAALRHQAGQQQAGALAIRQAAQRRKDIIAAEQELVQESARIGFGERRHMADGGQGILLRIERLLLLGHIADAHAAAQAHPPGARRQTAGNGAQQGGLAGAVGADQSHALSVPYVQIKAAEQCKAFIANGQVFQNQHIAPAGGRIAEFELELPALARLVDMLFSKQMLQAALDIFSQRDTLLTTVGKETFCELIPGVGFAAASETSSIAHTGCGTL